MKNMFWADQLSDAMINRKKFNYLKKQIPKQEKFVIKSSTSISGVPHIGNASDIIRHGAVVRALKESRKKVRFMWVAEDMDALRKVPVGIPKEFKKYLGMPVVDLPCPEKCCESYAKHFSKIFLNSLKNHFGEEPKYISTAEMYRSGKFLEGTKKALKNIEKIKTILNKKRKEPLPDDWSPWKPICEKCGKLMTTVSKLEGDKVVYECKDYEFKPFGEKVYTKLKGCGHKGESDLKNGKLLWRVEWGMEWATWKVSLEGAGKEHFMSGGSFWSAGEICENVYAWPEPYPEKNSIQPYEYFLLDGEKMSASKGNVIATWEWPNFAPPETLRLFMLKRPIKVRDLPISSISRLVDELDKLEKVYFGKIKVENKKEEAHLKRLYELCLIEKKKKFLNRVPFSSCIMIAQFVPTLDKKRIVELLTQMGYKLSKDESEEALKRIKLAAKWVELYAPEEEKFILQESISNKVKKQLSEKQIQCLKKLKTILKKDMKEDKIHQELYSLCKKENVPLKDFFEAVYLILVNKTRGPKLAPFIVTIGRKKVIDLIDKATS
jgi:lysyl-tRNA synthetase class 1